jgi:hypothetical protein
MKRLVVAAFAAFLVFGATTAQAVERTKIQYALGGVVEVIIPTGFTSPVFTPLAPGPAGLGSSVTFLFDSTLSYPIVSGNVTILTFTQSNGITIPGLAIGYNAWALTANQTITGGHLFPGEFAMGPNVVTGVPNAGYLHCIATTAGCPVIGIPTFYQSFQIPRNPTLPVEFGQPIQFPFAATSTLVPPASITIGGWFFTPALLFTQVTGIRPFCTSFVTLGTQAGLCDGAQGIITLVGTEIGRTKIETPEPAVLPLVALSLLGAGGVAVWSRRRNKA